MKKGISPVIATVILILLVFATAVIISPWLMDIIERSTDEAGGQAEMQIKCEKVAYTFDTTYENSGLFWNTTADPDIVQAKVINTGYQNIWNFSFEITTNSSAGFNISYFDVNASYQKTQANPLKPGQSAILRASISSDIANSSVALYKIKVMNDICPNYYIEAEV